MAQNIFLVYLKFTHLYIPSTIQAKDSDPNRLFNSRGGQLLKDQNMMRHLTKELPKVEKELQTVLTQWEEDYERYFIVNDNRYLDTIESQWAEKNVKKEQEKVVRVSL